MACVEHRLELLVALRAGHAIAGVAGIVDEPCHLPSPSELGLDDALEIGRGDAALRAIATFADAADLADHP